MALTKVDDRGLNTPVDLQDNEQIRLGTSNDLRFYHDGTHSFVEDAGTGQLRLCGDNGVVIRKGPYSDVMINAVADGAVELYHNNSKKFQTNGAGVDIFENLYLGDNVNLKLGTGADLKLYHTGTHSYIDNATGSLFLRGDAIKLRNAAGTEAYIECFADGAVKLSYDDSIKLETKSDGARFTGHLYSNDNEKLRLGTGHDFEIYHDGSRNTIQSTNSHNIEIKIGSNTVIKAGGAGEAQLLYSGNKKLETVTGGVEVTGELQCDSLDVDGTAEFTPGSGNFVNFFGTSNHAKWDFNNSRFLWDDNAKAAFGNGADLNIYHNSNNNWIDADQTLYVRAPEFSITKRDGTEFMAKFLADSGVELYNNNVKKFATGANGVYHDCNGTLHENCIHFEIGQNTGDYGTLFGVTNYPDASGYGDQNDGHWARIQAKGGCVVVINSDGSAGAARNNFDHFSIYQKAGDSTNGRRLFSVDGSGAAQFGRAGIRIDNSWAAQPSITVQRNNNDNTNNTDDTAYMRVHGIGETHETWTGAGSAGADFSANFLIDGSTYATSDGRAKTDIVDCPYGLDVVNKLQPRKYQLVNSQLEKQGDDNINLGFIAQEIKEHIPECVNYLGDEANIPNEKGWARAYALDIGEVIPVLVKAIQELSAQVTALKAA